MCSHDSNLVPISMAEVGNSLARIPQGRLAEIERFTQANGLSCFNVLYRETQAISGLVEIDDTIQRQGSFLVMASPDLACIFHNLVGTVRGGYVCCRWGKGKVSDKDLPYLCMMIGNVPRGCMASVAVIKEALKDCAEAEKIALAILAGQEQLGPEMRCLVSKLKTEVHGSEAAMHITDLVQYADHGYLCDLASISSGMHFAQT